jgi:hypothetical protein
VEGGASRLDAHAAAANPACGCPSATGYCPTDSLRRSPVHAPAAPPKPSLRSTAPALPRPPVHPPDQQVGEQDGGQDEEAREQDLGEDPVRAWGGLRLGRHADPGRVLTALLFALATVQYSAIQYNTVQYSTIQCNTVQYSAIQCNTVQYSAAAPHSPSFNSALCRARHFRFLCDEKPLLLRLSTCPLAAASRPRTSTCSRCRPRLLLGIATTPCCPALRARAAPCRIRRRSSTWRPH